MTVLKIPTSAAIANGDTVTVNFPVGAVTADFIAAGARVRAFGTDYAATVTIGASSFTFAWPGPALPAGQNAYLTVMPSPTFQSLTGSELHIGQVGGTTVRTQASFTRPADTTAYASGDAVANSTTAGSIVPMTFAIGRGAATGGRVRRARLRKTGTGVTNASFRLHLYSVSPVSSNGDNAAWLTDSAIYYVGAIDITVDKAFSDGAAGNGVPNTGLEINFTAQTYYGLLEARGAYTPASAEVFTVDLEVLQN